MTSPDPFSSLGPSSRRGPAGRPGVAVVDKVWDVSIARYCLPELPVLSESPGGLPCLLFVLRYWRLHVAEEVYKNPGTEEFELFRCVRTPREEPLYQSSVFCTLFTCRLNLDPIWAE